MVDELVLVQCLNHVAALLAHGADDVHNVDGLDGMTPSNNVENAENGNQRACAADASTAVHCDGALRSSLDVARVRRDQDPHKRNKRIRVLR